MLEEITQRTQATSKANGLAPTDRKNCFERILGVRCGHIRGIEHKPPIVVSMYNQEQPMTQQPP